MAELFTEGIALKCQGLTLANSGVDGGGNSRTTVTLLSSEDLDPANTGNPVGYVTNGLVFANEVFEIGNIIFVNSRTAINYPSQLDNLGNAYYGAIGFAGYIASIVARTEDGGSAVQLDLQDERWKWSQIQIPNILINNAQAPGVLDAETTIQEFARRRELSALQIIDLLEQFVRNFHNDFNFSYHVLPDRQIGEISFSGSALDILNRILKDYYGTKYQTYSNGAGHIEIVQVETNKHTLGSFSVSRDNLISNEIALARTANEDVDVVVGIGANKQYYVGDGLIDNELVPDWDWYNDNKILIIDKSTLMPAMYKDLEGKFRLVNPTNIRIDISVPDKPIFLSPTGTGSRVIEYTANSSLLYNLILYQKQFEKNQLTSRYCYATTYAIDALLRVNGLNDPIHNGRFRRFRLKDNVARSYTNSDGTETIFRDEDFYPRKTQPDGTAKLFAGDPFRLNEGALSGNTDYHDPIAINRYEVLGERVYEGYKVVILDNFINSASHEIRLMRERPGTYLTSIESDADYDSFIPVVDENDPRYVKEGSSYGPIVCKYDLIQGARVDNTGSTVKAERVKADGFTIVNGNKILFAEPQIIASHTIDASLFYPTDQVLLNPAPVAFYDDSLYSTRGVAIAGSNGNPLKWYYMLKNGNVAGSFYGNRVINYPTRKSKPYKTGTEDKEMYFYQESPYPIAIPRMEIFCFVQYSDFPERERLASIANIPNSAYWKYIKSVFMYPESSSLEEKRVRFDSRDDLVIQYGGYNQYSGYRTRDKELFEVISFYDSANLNIAEDFETSDKALTAIGHKRVILSFQLRNDLPKFITSTESTVSNFVPKGTARYHDRYDLFPETNNRFTFINSVNYSFDSGTVVDISYGGMTPRIKDLYYRDQKRGAEIRLLLESLENMSTTRANVPLSQGRLTT